MFLIVILHQACELSESFKKIAILKIIIEKVNINFVIFII